MPNIKSAKKRVLVTKVKDARNQAARSELKTVLKKFDAAVASEDKAVAKNLIHKNKAANKKSALTLKLNASK